MKRRKDRNGKGKHVEVVVFEGGEVFAPGKGSRHRDALRKVLGLKLFFLGQEEQLDQEKEEEDAFFLTGR